MSSLIVSCNAILLISFLKASREEGVDLGEEGTQMSGEKEVCGRYVLCERRIHF